MTEEKRWIIRHSRTTYGPICGYLIDAHHFADMAFVARDISIKSKTRLLRALIEDTIRLVGKLRCIQDSEIVLAVSYLAIPLMALQKLGLLRSQRLIWFGLFVHSPHWFFLFRALVALLSSPKLRYIVFAESDRLLYHEHFGIPLSQILYVPYGHWAIALDESPQRDVARSETVTGDTGVIETGGVEAAAREGKDEKSYYFSGGASNRDYTTLIEIFRQRAEKLVIVCSSVKNPEVLSVDLSDNIQVHTDTSPMQFDCFVKDAKACIMLIKYDTGAAGQSVLLRYMKYSKLIVASDTSVIREYIENQKSGILVKDPRMELPQILDALAANPKHFAEFGGAAHQHYLGAFTRASLERALTIAIFQ